jgi:WD40 repeat protein
MSLRTFIGIFICAALFVLAFAACSRLLPIQPLMSVPAPHGAASPSFSWDGTLLVAHAVNANKGFIGDPVRYWHIPDGREQTVPIRGWSKAPDPTEEYALTEFLPTGELFLRTRSSTQFGSPWSLQVINPSSGEERFRIESNGSIGCISADGTKIASFTADHTEIWDVPTRTLVARLACGPPIAFSSDRRMLLSHAGPVAVPYTYKMELALWNIGDRRELYRIRATAQLNGTFAEFSRNGKTLVTSGAIHWCSPTVWDVESGIEKQSLSNIRSWAVVEDGNVLAGLAENEGKQSELQFWDLDSGQRLDVIGLEVPDTQWEGIDDSSLRASSDGRILALSKVTESKIRVLPPQLPQWRWLHRLWDDRELREVAEIWLYDSATRWKIGTIGGVRYVQPTQREYYIFSHDGRMLASLHDDGTIKVWEVPPREPIWLAATLAAAFVGGVWTVRFGYQRLRRRLASRVIAK